MYIYSYLKYIIKKVKIDKKKNNFKYIKFLYKM